MLLNEIDVLTRLYKSRTGSLLLIGEDAETARKLCFASGGPMCGGYEMGGDSFVASITPYGTLTIAEHLRCK